MTDTYDVVVIGGGAAGENAAWYARDNGLSVALVEQELVGGECSYWACMPSKALLRPGEALGAARRVPGAAPAITGGVDVGGTLRSRDAFASHWDDKYQVKWLDSVNIDLVRGAGRLSGERQVTVETSDGERTLRASRAVVLATGTTAAYPPVEGLAEIKVWDSRDAAAAKQVPHRLLVLGGGVVGVEMAQAYRRLGARQVTVVEMLERLLPGEEPVASVLLQKALEAEDITVLTGTKTVRAVRKAEDGPVTLTLDDGRTLEGDELLVATGRRPNTGDLAVETVGLEGGRYVEVDDRLRAKDVAGNWLYAVGDVNGRALLTHQGKYQGRVAADVIAGEDTEAWADHRAVPRVAFTDPHVAAVGLTEAQARKMGMAVNVLQVPLGSVAATALLGRDIDGVAQLVVDEPRRIIVGATFVGPMAGALLHAATIAIVSKITLEQLWHAVPAFPTLNEVWLRLLEADRGL